MGRHGPIERDRAAVVFPKLLTQAEIDRRAPMPKRARTWIDILPRRHPPEPPRTNGSTHPAARGNLAACRSITLSVRNLHEHGDLFSRFLRARHEVFIRQKGWQLPETDGMEFDQYDTPLARWIVLDDGRHVLGGARISPTTAVCGNHSYMLRDAQLGLLPGLPRDILFEEAPVDSRIWEAARLFISDAVPSQNRLAMQRLLMHEIAAAARRVGATHIIGIVPGVFKRWLNRIGMTAEAVGPPMLIDGDRVQAALMSVIDFQGYRATPAVN